MNLWFQFFDSFSGSCNKKNGNGMVFSFFFFGFGFSWPMMMIGLDFWNIRNHSITSFMNTTIFSCWHSNLFFVFSLFFFQTYRLVVVAIMFTMKIQKNFGPKFCNHIHQLSIMMRPLIINYHQIIMMVKIIQIYQYMIDRNEKILKRKNY